MLENSHVRHSILAVLFLYGMVKGLLSCCIFLVLLIIDFISSASFILYSIIIALIGEERAVVYAISIIKLVHLYAPTFVCAH